MTVKAFVCLISVISHLANSETFDESLEGYFTFIEAPSAIPPRIRPPPYTYTQERCKLDSSKNEVSLANFCGDLSKGIIPLNPLNQSVMGEPYPFELIRNHTLKFLSKALPALVSDRASIPKVTELLTPDFAQAPGDSEKLGYQRLRRSEREVPKTNDAQEGRATNRKFCEEGGIFCTIYRVLSGSNSDAEAHVDRASVNENDSERFDSPPTPCPARVEYVTPIYARSYLGSWRYVVQIPYEGYFTQTVEVTKCLQVRCYYLEGGCLSSPRWVSLLVAEIFYPTMDSTTPAPQEVPQVQDFQTYQQFLKERAEPSQKEELKFQEKDTKAVQCDGHDEIGCFQVRLYYDWFLIPGSCKCWKPQYFAKYVRKNSFDL